MFFVFRKGVWLLGIVLLMLFLFLPGYTKVQELRDKNRTLEVSIKKLTKENELLQQELKRIENDPVYQEKIAREKMGVVRKGEIPVKLVPQDN